MRSGGRGMRAFPVRLPSGARYWTVLDEDLGVVGVADSFLRQGRVGRGGAGAKTKSYANSIALLLRWCAPTGRAGQAGGGGVGVLLNWAGARGPGRRGAAAPGR